MMFVTRSLALRNLSYSFEIALVLELKNTFPSVVDVVAVFPTLKFSLTFLCFFRIRQQICCQYRKYRNVQTLRILLTFSFFTRKFWRFSTTKQLLEAIFKASLSPDEYNISMNVMENCDGGTLDGMNISHKLTKVLNISSSVLVPRGENDDVDVLERNIQDMIKLPRTNAYHTQLVKYEAKSEVRTAPCLKAVENATKCQEWSQKGPNIL